MTVNTRGDGNVLLTPSMIANRFLMRLMSQLVIPRLSSFDYDEHFANAIGDEITIKKPYYAFVTKGRKLTDGSGTTVNQINPIIDQSVTIKVDQHFKAALRWNAVEKTLDIRQFSARYLDTLIEDLGYVYDQAGANALAEQTPNAVGTAGTDLTQDVMPFIRAQAEEIAIPSDMNNFGIINPYDSATLTKDLAGAKGDSGKFNENIVKDAIERRFVGDLQEFRVFRSIHIPELEVQRRGSFGTPLVNGADQDGSSIDTDTWGSNSVTVMKKGQMFTIAGVKEVYPRSWKSDLTAKRETGRLKVFTVTEDAATTAAGAVNVKFAPSMNDGTATVNDGSGTAVTLKAFQNVSDLPADNAAITVIGLPAATGTRTYRQNIWFHRRALHYVPVQLEELESATVFYRATEPQTNMSISATQYLQGDILQETLRLDTLFGVKNIYPELSMRQLTGTL